MQPAGALWAMYSTSAQLNKEEHVDCLQPHCLNGEEVTGKQLLTIVTNESAPTAALLAPVGSRRYVLPFQYISDSGAPNPVAEFE